MQKYNYTFALWPPAGSPKCMLDLFEILKQNGQRITMPFTADEFYLFRAGIAGEGLCLIDIERVPVREPEVVE